MNILAFQVRLPEVKNNLVYEAKKVINYTVFLNETRLNDYNHSILIPAKTVIIEDLKEILKLDFEERELNISFTQARLMKEIQAIKTKTKTINTGLLGKHDIIQELITKTPIFLDRDSIQQSLELLEINKTINSYESILPQNMILDYIEARKDAERIKIVKSSLNYAHIRDGFAFTGPSVNEARKGFRIKNYMPKAKYYFTREGEPFYTLGKLARISNELNDIWNTSR